MFNLLNKIRKISLSELPLRVKLGLKMRLQNSPATILIQTTSACNLKCRHCFLNYYGETIPDGKIKFLDLEDFKKTANKLSSFIKKANYLQFSSFEPLLNKDLFKMMDYALEINPKLQFYIHSNGILINEKNIAELEKRPIFEITLSLDGTTKEIVEQFKTDVNFSQIINNIKLLTNSKLKEKTGIVFVLHKNNKHQLLDYPDFVKELGVNKIYINNLMPFLPKFEQQVLFSKIGNPEVEDMFKTLAKIVKTNKQKLQIPELKPQLTGCSQCNLLYVDIDGNVSPCDYLAVSTPFALFGETQQLKPIIYGNIFEIDIKQIYNSPGYVKFRKSHANGIIPKHCRLCINSYGLLCSNRTMIE